MLEIIGMPQDFCPNRCAFMRFGTPFVRTSANGGNALNDEELPQHTHCVERYPAQYRPKLNCVFENVCAAWQSCAETTEEDTP